MKTTGNANNMALLQQFAVKSNKKNNVENNRAIIYNRCSSEKQDSLEWQGEQCTRLANELKVDIIKTFDAKESAQTDDRVVFKEMRKFCTDAKIGHIIVYSYDRLTRSGDVGILKKLRDKGIKVHAATQMVDDETPSGRFTQDMYLLFAKMENEQRRDRIILGQRNKLRRGEWIGVPPIGYEKRFVTGKKEHDLDKRQCFINDAGILLKQAFYWKDQENLSNTVIIDRLSKMGLSLTLPLLTRIFRNPFYAGYISSTLLDDGEIIRGKHEAMVSEELFLRVNGIVKEQPHGWNQVRRHEEMPLKASVICQKCNRPLTGYHQKQAAYTYYKCPNKGCNTNVRNVHLHKLFGEELSRYRIPFSFFPVIQTQLKATYEMLHASETAREKPMKDELTRLKNELDQIELNFATNKISSEIFEKFSLQHKTKIQEIEQSLISVPQNSSNLDVMLENAMKMASNLLNMWQLCDYQDKVRLQKLIFPEGLRYDHENGVVRTHKINPIISAITSISISNGNTGITTEDRDSEILRQLYLMFPSSNFFWASLKEINTEWTDFERNYSQVWQSGQVQFLNQSTGRTETVMFQYNSNTTLAQENSHIPAIPASGSTSWLNSGSTIQSELLS